MQQGYDIVGDIHGHARELEMLLSKLGYRETEGVYQHPERIAVFVGDLIDGEGDNRRVIDVVRRMAASGNAHVVMGNHEYNAICYQTPDPDRPGDYLRPHTEKNLGQHEETLAEFEGEPEALAETIQWFQTLPLYLELDGMRIVHACWDPASIKLLDQQLGPGATLTDAFLVRSAQKGSPEHAAVETVLKGAEIGLPEGVGFSDKDDNYRDEARICWWLHDAEALDEMVIGPPELYEATNGQSPQRDALIGYGSTEPPVFFGHYWLHGTPALQTSNVACLDYSIGRNDKLVAYRWQGERHLNADNLLWVAHSPGQQQNGDRRAS